MQGAFSATNASATAYLCLQ